MSGPRGVLLGAQVLARWQVPRGGRPRQLHRHLRECYGGAPKCLQRIDFSLLKSTPGLNLISTTNITSGTANVDITLNLFCELKHLTNIVLFESNEIKLVTASEIFIKIL